MKRVFVFLTAVAVCGLAAAGYQEFVSSSPASAQRSDRIVSKVKGGGFGNDSSMADEIEKLTDRSTAGLESKPGPNGVIVDLAGRFQSVMIARLEDENDSAAACVTSLDEANAFLGRNLRTGERLEKTVVERPAADHGMTEDELRFYKKMIEDAQANMALRPEAATITIVNNDGAGEGFNDPTPASLLNEGGNSGSTRGAQRMNVFNAAATIWGSFLDSSVETRVNAQFNPLTCSPTSATLGSAGTAFVNRDFPGAPFEGTWYHGALSNKLANMDFSDYEINAQFNSNIDSGCFGGASRFYYGLDGNTPAGTTNLLVVVLHELGHGLGFSSFVNGSTGALFNGQPDAYTRYMYDQSVGLRWNQMSDSQRQASATNSGNVFWDGPNVKVASSFLTAGRDSSGRVALYTPTTFAGGSSISHFSTAASPNLLMEPNINVGLAITGDLTRQQLRDMGWYRDSNADTSADAVINVTPNGGGALIGSNRTITWTNGGGFSRNVTIELSTDGGATYPTVIASNIANTGSFNWNVPNIPTQTARVRVREADFAEPAGVSSANFIISNTPVASTAIISGRVLDQSGRAVNRATVVLTDSNGAVRRALTSAFGYFVFEDVPTGDNYVGTVRHKLYQFQPQTVNLTGNFTDMSFVAVN